MSNDFNISNRESFYQLLANCFKFFIIRSIEEVDPATRYCHNWHIDYLADILESVRKKEIKRLIINMPPRNLKSIITSVALPAWILGHSPAERIIVSSYSQQLAIKHSMDTKIIMQSEWYRKIFPNTIIGAKDRLNTKYKFATQMNGYRLATSVGGTLTGEGGNVLIVDDPHNPINIHSKKDRERVIRWFTEVFLSRLNDKKNGIVIIVMQRLHHEDLTGYITEYNLDRKWQIVSMPAIEKQDTIYSFNDKIYQIRSFGDVLNTQYEGYQQLMSIKNDIGDYVFETQYQQNPYMINGNIIKKEWLKYTNLILDASCQDTIFFFSIDCASGIKINNDFTVIMIFIEINNKLYLYDIVRDKFEYPSLKNKLYTLNELYKPTTILIENASNGTSLIQDLSKDIPSIKGLQHFKSKETRINSAITFLSSERLSIRDNQSWKIDFEREMLDFPNGKNDDQVDTLSQFINWYIQYSVDKLKNTTHGPRFRIL